MPECWEVSQKLVKKEKKKDKPAIIYRGTEKIRRYSFSFKNTVKEIASLKEGMLCLMIWRSYITMKILGF